MAGTLAVLLLVASLRARYISYQATGVLLGLIVGLFVIMVIGYNRARGRAVQKNMVQFSGMGKERIEAEEHEVDRDDERVLSSAEARQWLDDFLVSQQKAGK